MAELSLCLDLLRQTDRDRYLAALLVPAQKRDDVAALYAFNAEMARIRDLVREPLPGEVRLQFWRDLLSGTPHGEAMQSPLAAALMGAITRHSLPAATLVEMIDARVFDLYDDPVETTGQFELYAGHTASALIQLTSLVLDPVHASGTAEAAGHAGVAQCVAGSLLLMGLHRSRGQVYLPLDILSATGLDRDSFLDGSNRKAVSAAITAFAGFGRDHLARARASARGKVTPDLAPAFVPASSVDMVLDRASRLGAGLFETGIQPAQWRRQWRMWRTLRNRMI